MTNIKNRGVSFNLDDPEQSELYSYCDNFSNFSGYVKGLIIADRALKKQQQQYQMQQQYLRQQQQAQYFHMQQGHYPQNQHAQYYATQQNNMQPSQPGGVAPLFQQHGKSANQN